MSASFYTIDPEVAGGLGAETVMDRRVRPPHVSRLHYVFEGWLGDQLIQSFPCYLVTESLEARFASEALTGYSLRDVTITKSELFIDMYGERSLPAFRWFDISGLAGTDDFGRSSDHRLVVSARALALINLTGPTALIVRPHEEENGNRAV